MPLVILLSYLLALIAWSHFRAMVLQRGTTLDYSVGLMILELDNRDRIRVRTGEGVGEATGEMPMSGLGDGSANIAEASKLGGVT
ncbi:hypothetical protein Sjap_013174 [Stephania japonica]|uniref:Uncharacterized protein n=1 Tax=Stephania japonica TaxID=461633 RepID=A0AAP0IZD5_9MAGN